MNRIDLAVLCLATGVLLSGMHAPHLNANAVEEAVQTPLQGTVTCQIPPRTFEELASLFATPWAATPIPVAEKMEGGQPAPDQIVREVEYAVARIVACLNRGEPLRTWALYTDRYVQEIMATDGEYNAAFLQQVATPAPVIVNGQIQLLSVANVQILPDHRVRATVRLRPALIPVDKTFLFILVPADAQWLLDDVVDELDLALP